MLAERIQSTAVLHRNTMPHLFLTRSSNNLPVHGNSSTKSPQSAVVPKKSDARLHRMTQPKSNDPLHGVTLERLLTVLVELHGWEELGYHVPIRCFLFDPSIKSSLTFLRKTPWARTKVEQLYIEAMRKSPPA